MLSTATLRNFLLTLLVPFSLIGAGTLGFHFLEGQDFNDSLYLTVMTLTTVGYGDITPKTVAGRYFTMALVVTGVFSFFYAATTAIRFVVSGELQQHIGRQQMERTLAQMKDHIIVCGYGRMGRLVCLEFAAAQVPFVIIDHNAEHLKDFALADGIPVVGDAHSDETLTQAGIERARGLVTVMSSDSENLFTTMSARLLNSRLMIVARVEESKSETKLLRAGANRVVSPYQIGGSRVANAILRPTVMDFIELATRTEYVDLQLEETQIAGGSLLAGKKLIDSRISADHRIIIVAVKKGSREMLFNPDPQTVLEADDILVALGHRDHLEKLEKLANPQ